MCTKWMWADMTFVFCLFLNQHYIRSIFQCLVMVFILVDLMTCASFLISALITRLLQLQWHLGPFPSPFCSLLCKFIWPLQEAAVKRMLNLVPEKLDGVPDVTVNRCVSLVSQVHSTLSSSLDLGAPLGQRLFYFSFVCLATGTEYEINTCLIRALNFLICKIG